MNDFRLSSSFHNSILNCNCEFTFTTSHMYMWGIMVKSININQYTLYYIYCTHIFPFLKRIYACKVTLLFGNRKENQNKSANYQPITQKSTVNYKLSTANNSSKVCY